MIDWHKTAFLFPGQGSQMVGMGADIAAHYPAARSVFEQADSVLKTAFSHLLFEGPEAELNQTYNTQPSVFVAGIAILRALQAALGQQYAPPALLAGHSVGEFTALVAADALDFANGLRLVRERARLMGVAGDKHPGAMAAILGLEGDVIREICDIASTEVGKPLVLANDNCPGQIVISGDREALAYALPLATEKGARRIIPIPVSVAAHSPLMDEAAEAFRELLGEITISAPVIGVVANASATILQSAAEVRAELAMQITAPVRWTESIQLMRAQGITTFVELGPKGVLKGLLRRIDRSANGIVIETAQDIETLLQG